MDLKIKLFNYKGIPINLNILFLLLLFFLSVPYFVAIFISILLHEIGHAYMAVRYGYKVDNIEIGLFFGQANMDIDSIREGHLINIAIAGPCVNFILMIISFILQISFPCMFFNAMCITNFLLFITNIIPIFPLDGGRILRSILILKTDDKEKSTKISAWVSFVFSSLLIFYYISIFSIIGIIFSILFLLYSMRELGYWKS